MRVEVKQHHIENGHSGDYEACPIALAILENPPFPVEHVEVHAEEIFIIPEGCGWEDVVVFPLPAEATKFVIDFDAERDVEPFGFDL